MKKKITRSSLIKLFFAFSFYLFFTDNSYSQTDTVFWFAAPEISNAHGDRPILLRLATLDNPSSVTISLPANPAFVPITIQIPANSSNSFNLTPYIDQLENQPINAILNKGILIQASTFITAYYEIVGRGNNGTGQPYNSEIFALKGRNAVGTRFYTPFQTTNTNGDYGGTVFSTIDIVATKDYTTVTITPSRNAVGHPAGQPFTVTLMKGQTYSVQASGLQGADHLAGTLIVSDKPIAVTVKDDSVELNGGFDIVGDQIVPVGVIGSEYIVLKGELGAPGERAYVLATSNNTSIFLNGSTTPVATINAGQTYVVPITTPAVSIQTSGPGGVEKPVYVLHTTGFGNEISGALLPPTNCTGSKQVSFVRSTTDPFYLNILALSTSVNDFLLNGQAGVINASSFEDVGTDGKWKAAHILLDLTIIREGEGNVISNSSSEFHLGILNGTNSETARYGYFSDFSSLNLDYIDKPVCFGETIELDAGPNRDDYTWKKFDSNNNLEIVGTDQFLPVSGPGTYVIDISKGTCSLSDTVEVKYHPEVTIKVVKDTFLCETSQYTIDATTAGIINYLWQDGSTNPKFTPSVTGKYWVTATTSYGCKSTDTANIIINPIPAVTFSSPNDIFFCSGKSEEMGMENNTNYNYSWSPTNGLSDPTISKPTVTLINSTNAPEKTKYYIEVEDKQTKCTKIDAVDVTVNPVTKPNFTGLLPLYCLNATPANLTGTPTGGTFKGTGMNGDIFNPAIVGSHDIYYIYENSYTCKDSVSKPVTVAPLPVASFMGLKSSYCENGAPSQLITGAFAGGTSGFSGKGVTGNTFTPSSVGKDTVYYKIVDNNGCKDSTYRATEVFPLPVVTVSPDDSICIKGVKELTASGGISYLWLPGNETGSSITVSPETTTVYEVSATSQEGCISLPKNVTVYVKSTPVASFAERKKEICFDTDTLILNAGFSPNYLWSTGETTPSIIVKEEGLYKVKFSNELNCSTEDEILVVAVCPPALFVPKAFTPNNDGTNDLLVIFGNHFTKFEMKIFNRWGEVIFVSTDRNLQWDGKYLGEEMPAGVYPWVISYESLNEVSKAYSLKGSATLIR